MEFAHVFHAKKHVYSNASVVLVQSLISKGDEGLKF